MKTWSDIFNEIQATQRIAPNGQVQCDFDGVLFRYIKMFSEKRNRNVIVYYSDWLNQGKGPNIDLNDSDMTGIVNAVSDLNPTLGLDIIIHTPGGNPLATEGIVKYLHEIFGNNIELFVPHMCMSAGTMLACSCKKIWMGEESFLGPIDPQFNGIPAYNIKKEFENAKDELINKPDTFRNWQLLLNKYPPAFYYSVLDSIKLSSKLVKDWLKNYMFESDVKKNEKSKQIVKKINCNTGSHSKHFNYNECKKIGLKVVNYKGSEDVHELVSCIYNCCQIIGGSAPMCKMIVNQNGKRYIINSVNAIK